MNTNKLGLSSSSFSFNLGVVGQGTDRGNLHPWTVEQFVEFAKSCDFGGVEIPLMRFVPDLEIGRLHEIKSTLTKHKMFFLMDADAALDAQQIISLIPLARDFGSPFIRIKSSDILGGARKKLGRPWIQHVEHCVSVLKKVAPQCRDNGLKIALENHQDLDSSDLLRIVEKVGDGVVGVNFDIGNAFSLCEDPLMFIRKLGPLIINIHLKDYKIFQKEGGFYLVRCALGDGAVDFKAVLPLLAKVSPVAKMVIELGALQARKVLWLEPGFWEEIQPRNNEELTRFFQLLEKRALRVGNDSWKTPWERVAPAPDVAAYEVAELKASLACLSTL